MPDINDIERRLAKLEARVETNLRDQNKVNLTAYKHVMKLEQRFAKMDKAASKLAKMADPRARERETLKMVDNALKAFDKKFAK